MIINVFCALGMSTSVVVKKIRKEAEAQGIDLTIDAHSVNDLETFAPGSDIILIGPQISYRQKELQEKYPEIPVVVMNVRDYGTGNAKNILKQVSDALKK